VWRNHAFAAWAAKNFFQKIAESLRIQYQTRFAGGSILGASSAIMLGRLVSSLQFVAFILLAVILISHPVAYRSGPKHYGDHLPDAGFGQATAHEITDGMPGCVWCRVAGHSMIL
jgi:hypothetical protein